jgi:hypothetical protein
MVRTLGWPDGGAIPIPTHGPQAGSNSRAPAETYSASTPDRAMASRAWRDPGDTVMSSHSLTPPPLDTM